MLIMVFMCIDINFLYLYFINSFIELYIDNVFFEIVKIKMIFCLLLFFFT